MSEKQHGEYTFAEINRQPTTFAAMVHTSATRKYALAISAGELVERGAPELPGSKRRTAIVPLSRTGDTEEVLVATEMLQRRYPNHHVMGIITTNRESDLVRNHPDTLVLPIPKEKSITQTSACSGMTLAANAGSVIAAGRLDVLRKSVDRYPGAARRLLEKLYPRVVEIAYSPSVPDTKLFFLGRGLNHAVSESGSITTTEMANVSVFPDKIMDFPHDTITLADEHSLVVGFLSDLSQEASSEVTVLKKVLQKGSDVVAIAETRQQVHDGVNTITLETDIDPLLRPALLLFVPQLLGFYMAGRKGLDPDVPRGLQPVVRYTEG